MASKPTLAGQEDEFDEESHLTIHATRTPTPAH